jgi:rhomboid-like protein
MSNVFSIAWRIPCPSGLRASPSSCLLPLTAPMISTLRPLGSFPRLLLQRPYSISNGRQISPQRWGFSARSPCFQLTGPISTVFSRSVKKQNKPTPQPNEQPIENGVPIRSQPLSAAQIKTIFGTAKVSPAMGNRILSVLQGRRLQGTLDLDLPTDITRAVRSHTVESGLNWLRKNYPVNEDAAILARIEREEREEEERLHREAEQLGLYKPQSGNWGAKLGEGNDIYGKSVLKEIREKNEARLLAEQEKERKEWLEGEAKDREKMEKMRMQLKRNTELQKYDEAALIEGG